MVLPCRRHRPYRTLADHCRTEHSALGLGAGASPIFDDYYAVKDKAALFKSVFLSPLILTVAVVVLVLLINASWPSEIIFDIPSANLGILFLIFLGHHADYPFFSSDFADERAGIGFFRQASLRRNS